MDDTALVSETLGIPAADGTADAFFTRPAGDGLYPAVLLHVDAYSLRPAVEAHAERLARHGYCVLAPNALYRSARAPVVDGLQEKMQADDRAPLFELLRPMMGLLTAEAVTADAERWLAFLQMHPHVRTGRIGTVGYCMGGRQALRMAGAFPDQVLAAASFHGGGLATDAEDSPHLTAVKAQGELYVGHADNDASMPPEQMGRLTQALAEAHVRHTAELYVGALHGWTQTDTPVYDEAAAERHWSQLTELFARAL